MVKYFTSVDDQVFNDCSTRFRFCGLGHYHLDAVFFAHLVTFFGFCCRWRANQERETKRQGSAIHVCLWLILRKMQQELTQASQQCAVRRYQQLPDDGLIFGPDQFVWTLALNHFEERCVAYVCYDRFGALHHRSNEAHQKTGHFMRRIFLFLGHKI